MSSWRLWVNKLRKGRIWQRMFRERGTEAIHLNVVSLFIGLFGSFRQKVNWDLVYRQPYAYGVLKAADLARQENISAISVVEIGVASGAGLMNLAMLAQRVEKATGVRVEPHGFDTGTGMPPAIDYRDHPELYQQGDFQMDTEGLRAILPANAQLHLGELSSTIPEFLRGRTDAPLGFVSIDVDYYSSTVEALELLRAENPASYLPLTVVYADDINLETHNSRAGEMLALSEFNEINPKRLIERHPFFDTYRIFRRAKWVRQILFFHVLDHPARQPRDTTGSAHRYIENPYLQGAQPRERFNVS